MIINQKKLNKIVLTSEQIENGIEAAGSNNKYHLRLIFIFIILKTVTDSFYCSLPYFLMNPNIMCSKEKSSEYNQICNLNEVCLINSLMSNENNNLRNTSNRPKIKFILNKEIKKNTFINHFDIYCNTIKIGLVGSSASIGNLLSNIISPFFTDNFGRIKTIKLSILYALLTVE